MPRVSIFTTNRKETEVMRALFDRINAHVLTRYVILGMLAILLLMFVIRTAAT